MHNNNFKRALIYLLSTCFLMICVIAQAQKETVIDISKSLEEQSDVEKLYSENELEEANLVLKGAPNNADKTSFNFGSANANRLIQNTGEKKEGNWIFSLKNFTDVYDDKTLKIQYTGDELDSIPIAFGDENLLSIKFTVTKSDNDGDDNQGNKSFSQTEIMKAAYDYIAFKYDPQKYFSEKKGIYLEKNTVRIFIDQNGNLIYTGIPTTAKETYLYQVTLLIAENSKGSYNYNFSYEGKYQPEFNILNTKEEKVDAQSTGQPEKPGIQITEINYPIIGPFTDNFTIKLDRCDIITDGKDKGDCKAGTNKSLLNSKIDVAKLYHVSIAIGLVKTTLRNPTNIEKVPLIENGTVSPTDSTLIADDPGTRGLITVMATYYPSGRSFLFPPSGGVFDPSRWGVVVGAQLSDKIDENFFLGGSWDFARGGSLTLGIHCGRRNYIAGDDYSNFNYGKDVFVGDLNVKKEWGLGFFFGVIIDARVAGELFKKL